MSDSRVNQSRKQARAAKLAAQKTAAGPACIHPGDNHSSDLLTVWHGKATPTRICGYHYARYGTTAPQAVNA